MLEVLLLYLIIPGRIDFLQLGRYGKYGEQRYRQQLEVDFDWLSFNSSLVKSHLGSRLAIAFDPSYISKSGKCTPYLVRFCRIVRVMPNVVWRFQALVLWISICIPICILKLFGLLLFLYWKQWTGHWYLHVFCVCKGALLKITCYVVADAYFSKATFMYGTIQMDFHVISRLRDDASLRITQLPSNGRGKHKQCDGKIDIKKIDESRFEVIVLDNGQWRKLSVVMNSFSLKRNIRLYALESADRKICKLYFSTDIQMEAKEIIDYYRIRFQIEFCYRNGKLFAGLTDCQSRNLNKLHLHFNASLTSVNPAKVKAIEKGTVLSMASVKILCHSIFLMQRFISVLEIKPNEEIN